MAADGSRPSRVRSPAIAALTAVSVFGAGYAVGGLDDRALEQRVRTVEARLGIVSPMAAVAAETIGFDQDGTHLIGSADARVALVLYTDFQCPYCAAFHRTVLPELRKSYVETGEVVLVVKHFPLVSIHPFAESAAAAVECAGRQGRFRDVFGLLSDEGAALSPEVIGSLGPRAGVDVGQWTTCRAGGAESFRFVREADEAKGLGFSATPAFVLGRTSQPGKIDVLEKWTGNRAVSDVAARIDAALKRRPN